MDGREKPCVVVQPDMLLLGETLAGPFGSWVVKKRFNGNDSTDYCTYLLRIVISELRG